MMDIRRGEKTNAEWERPHHTREECVREKPGILDGTEPLWNSGRYFMVLN